MGRIPWETMCRLSVQFEGKYGLSWPTNVKITFFNLIFERGSQESVVSAHTFYRKSSEGVLTLDMRVRLYLSGFSDPGVALQ